MAWLKYCWGLSLGRIYPEKRLCQGLGSYLDWEPFSISMTLRTGKGFWAEMLSVARTSQIKRWTEHVCLGWTIQRRAAQTL